LRAAYSINDHLTASLNLNNVFDRVYWQTLSQTYFGNWYGAPRSFAATLRGKW
jgi:outer membrane receptor for ferric coprogen and ferric-rhodotorulic acid